MFQLNYPGYQHTEFNAISPNGQYILGTVFDAGVGDNRSFIYSGGSFTWLPNAAGPFPDAGVNDFGDAASGDVIVDHTGKVTTLSYPGAEWTFAYGINDAGMVVGEYYGAVDDPHAFVYSKGAYQTLNLPGLASAAMGINNNGDIVGFWAPEPEQPFSGAHPVGFLDRNGVITTYYGYALSAPTDINNNGWMISGGGYLLNVNTGDQIALPDINDFQPNLYSIDNAGDIVGFAVLGGVTNAKFVGAELYPTPEPVSWSLCAVGLIGIAIRFRVTDRKS